VIVFGTRGIGAPCCRKHSRRASAERRSGYCQHGLTVDVRIRNARRDDVPLIFGWVVELAEYERAPEQVTGTPALLEEALFGPAPSAEAVIAETGEGEAVPWQPAGFALFHSTFSTWESRPGIWLEDLYVPPVHRRLGVGAALLEHLAKITVDRRCARLEWAALEWNEPALNFYEGIGARRLNDWVLHRLDGARLGRVAGKPGSAD
jgi:GNAT superfamily N-acetyltransferase